MRKVCYTWFILFPFILLTSCNGGGENNFGGGKTISFSNPVEVTLLGYSGDAQEPSISRDGSILFFNNLNSSTLPGGGDNDTNIHYASRIDDFTFQYVGEVSGANTDALPGVNELEGVASMDKNNKFYFVNTTDYLNPLSPDYLLSLFEADYANGSLSNIQSIPNLKSDRPVGQSPVPGELNFDAEIHYDGEFLYYVEGLFSGNPLPDEANIAVASKVAGVFAPDPDSSYFLNAVNTDALEYAPSISTDGLELYFTRAVVSMIAGYDFGIYVATRNFTGDPWGNVQRIDLPAGDFTEAPSISYDGSLLYYHQKVSGKFRICAAQRD